MLLINFVYFVTRTPSRSRSRVLRHDHEHEEYGYGFGYGYGYEEYGYGFGFGYGYGYNRDAATEVQTNFVSSQYFVTITTKSKLIVVVVRRAVPCRVY